MNRPFFYRSSRSCIKHKIIVTFEAQKDPTSSGKVILQNLRIGSSRISMWSDAVVNLAADLLIGTIFINKYVSEIFPSVQWLSLCPLQPLYLFLAAKKAPKNLAPANNTRKNLPLASAMRNRYNRLIAIRAVILTLHTHSPEFVTCRGSSTVV